jgi:hypothetical protein
MQQTLGNTIAKQDMVWNYWQNSIKGTVLHIFLLFPDLKLFSNN